MQTTDELFFVSFSGRLSGVVAGRGRTVADEVEAVEDAAAVGRRRLFHVEHFDAEDGRRVDGALVGHRPLAVQRVAVVRRHALRFQTRWRHVGHLLRRRQVAAAIFPHTNQKRRHRNNGQNSVKDSSSSKKK